MPLKDNILPKDSIKGSQFAQPYIEFSGACAGCGETPYIKLVTQLFGDRMMIANATGCSSIWGASAPSMPYTKDANGRGPSWANSLFEDNAEFGLGMLSAVSQMRNKLKNLIIELAACDIDSNLKAALDDWVANVSVGDNTRERADKVVSLIESSGLSGKAKELADEILLKKEHLIKRSLWCLGGDGWSYDIGYGGLDHVLASGEDINVLVFDTEVYSNTGGLAVLGEIGFDGLHIAPVFAANVVREPAAQHDVQLFRDVFPGLVARLEVRQLVHELFVQPFVDLQQAIAGILHQLFLEVEMGNGVVHHLGNHRAHRVHVMFLARLIHLVHQLNKAFVLGIDYGNTGFEIRPPLQCFHVLFLCLLIGESSVLWPHPEPRSTDSTEKSIQKDLAGSKFNGRICRPKQKNPYYRPGLRGCLPSSSASLARPVSGGTGYSLLKQARQKCSFGSPVASTRPSKGQHILNHPR